MTLEPKNITDIMSSLSNDTYLDKLSWQAVHTDAKLNGVEDYEHWHETLLDYFMFNNAVGILDDTYPMPSAPGLGRSPSRDYQRWQAINTKAMGALRMTLGTGPRNQVRGLTTARAIWNTMKTYQKTGSLVFNQIVQDLWDTTLATSDNVTNFANKPRRLNNEPNEWEHTVNSLKPGWSRYSSAASVMNLKTSSPALIRPTQ
jgi:hypothetical protein